MTEVMFHPEHLNAMVMRPREKEMAAALNFERLGAFAESARTLVHEGRILTCVGLVPMWKGVYEVWQIPSIYVAQYKIAYVKAMRSLLEHYAKEYEVRRMQTHSPADDLHDAWMKCVGFECEGTLKAYNVNGEDYRIWRKLWV